MMQRDADRDLVERFEHHVVDPRLEQGPRHRRIACPQDRDDGWPAERARHLECELGRRHHHIAIGVGEVLLRGRELGRRDHGEAAPVDQEMQGTPSLVVRTEEQDAVHLPRLARATLADRRRGWRRAAQFPSRELASNVLTLAEMHRFACGRTSILN